MPNSLTGILFALASFVLTFTVARMLAKWLKKRRTLKDADETRKNESRQVRRARERGKGGP